MTPEMIAQLPYRPCVGLMILNRENKVFVAKRIDMRTEAWQMPQGGIDEGEDAQAAALREMKEEIGTDNAEIIAESRMWMKYDLPQHLVPQLWDGKYRGQKQKWYALRYLGEDSDINIQTDIPEFTEWKWVDMESLPDIIVPFKQELYAMIVEQFRHLVK
jgi:putative (di)nucleoside polyphosphate hydrolase